MVWSERYTNCSREKLSCEELIGSHSFMKIRYLHGSIAQAQMLLLTTYGLSRLETIGTVCGITYLFPWTIWPIW